MTTTWIRVTAGLPPAGRLVRVVHVPRGWTTHRMSRALIAATDGQWARDIATAELGGTITHWAEDDGLDDAEQDWALEYARQEEATCSA